MTITIHQGDCRDVLPTLEAESVQCNHDSRGRFRKGTHWRTPQPHWSREWLFMRYVVAGASAQEIAAEAGCTENNILYWLDKHAIPRRTIAEARRVKKWAAKGKRNGMYGLKGKKSPNWQGGSTPERQAFYASIPWKKAVYRVWKRDKATCQRCHKTSIQVAKDAFHIHHIVSFRVKELRTELSNLVLLCRSCHRWVHSKANVQRLFIQDAL